MLEPMLLVMDQLSLMDKLSLINSSSTTYVDNWYYNLFYQKGWCFIQAQQ